MALLAGSFQDQLLTIIVLTGCCKINDHMQRYKELFGHGGVMPPAGTTFDLDRSLTEIDTGKIDYDCSLLYCLRQR